MSIISVSFEVLNTKNTPSIAADVAANRPATAATGALYISTDTNTLERWDGAAWQSIGGGGGGGIGGSGTANFVPIFTAATDIGNSTMQFVPGSIGVAPGFSVGTNTNITLPFTTAAAQPIGLYIYEGVATGFNFQRVVGAPSYNSIYSGNSKLELKLFDGATDYYHTFFSNGRVAINGITDTGYLFRVNGTSSFVGNMSVQGTIGATDTIQTSGGGVSTTISYSASTGIMGTSSNHSLDFRTNNTNSMRLVTSTNRLLINTTTDNGYQLNVNGSMYVSAIYVTTGKVEPALTTQDLGGAALAWRICYANTINAQASATALTLEQNLYGMKLFKDATNAGVAQILDYNAGNPSDTTILSIDSITRGVRFPRMTTAQRTAISSPPAGLMVFDTDLSHICFYDTSGTPGWRKLSYSNA